MGQCGSLILLTLHGTKQLPVPGVRSRLSMWLRISKCETDVLMVLPDVVQLLAMLYSLGREWQFCISLLDLRVFISFCDRWLYSKQVVDIAKIILALPCPHTGLSRFLKNEVEIRGASFRMLQSLATGSHGTNRHVGHKHCWEYFGAGNTTVG